MYMVYKIPCSISKGKEIIKFIINLIFKIYRYAYKTDRNCNAIVVLSVPASSRRTVES